MTAGLPNITGDTGGVYNLGNYKDTYVTTGAITTEKLPKSNSGVYDGRQYYGNVLGIDASKSSDIYGNSTTVTPLSRACKFLIRWKK